MREFNMVIQIVEEVLRNNNLAPLTKNMQDWSQKVKEE
jgi:hypothetical protein